jgi:uncharacterized membrane protein YqjE
MDPAPALAPGSSGTTPLEVVRVLRSGGGALLLQALLLGQLAHIEWQQEKQRLLQMFAAALLGFAGLLCVLLFAGGLVLLATWNTPYRLATLAGVVVVCAAGTVAAWRHFQRMAALGGQAFAALREELAADAALLKRNL